MTSEDLKEVRAIVRQLDELEQKKQVLRSVAISPPCTIGGNDSGKSGFRNGTENKIVAYLDRVREFDERIDALRQHWQCAYERFLNEAALTNLNEKEMRLLFLRYFRAMDWSKVNERLGVSRRHSFRILDSALSKLGKLENG